jgi:hypothetical protein
VRFYRDWIVDFHQNLHIANRTGKWMISFMFSSHPISNSPWLRGGPLSLSYFLFFNGLYVFPSDSVLPFAQERWAKRSRVGPYIVYLISATFFMKVPSFLMHVDFFEKTDQKIVSIDDISRYITIYRDIISQLIGLTYRDKIVDIVAI